MTPATDLALSGHALIEASAGTGKTWTLSGILLRLLVEDGREPRHIVATTFTRAAATEMRQRIYARVGQFRALLLEIIKAYADDPALLADDADLARRVLAHLDTLGDDAVRDSVNRHILQKMLETQGVDGLILAYRRSSLALETLDQLFIGTLDSLCQRWLHELALESGIDTIRINTAPDAIAQLTHDYLRRHYQEQAQRDAALFAAYYATSPAPDVYIAAAKTALNYGNAPFVHPAPPDYDPAARAAALDTLATFTPEDLAAAQDTIAAAVAADHLMASRNIARYAHALPAAAAALIQRQPPKDDAQKWLDGLDKARASADSGQDPFKKKAPAAARQALINHPVLAAIHAADNARHAFDALLAHMRAQSLSESSDHVRRHLPAALRQSGETTYSELLARLNTILADKPALAAYLAHRYPVILVDESQDLNHAQADLLRHIYLQPHHNGFCLLVGDPKQAIYRFRGSDVANYTALKTRIPAHASLADNYRSAPALIAALNDAYQHPDNARLGDGIAYQPVHAANPERPLVQRDGSAITAPLQTLTIDSAADESHAIARLTAHLVSNESPYLRRSNNTLHPLQPSDILILARGHKSLQRIEHALQQTGIATHRDADASLFAHSIAHELQWYMAALLDPGNSPAIRRLLAGKCYGFDLATLDTLADSREYTDFHARLSTASERWNQHGLLAALQYLWRHDPWDGNIWTRLASQPHPDALRDLLDLRRLQEIIAAHEQPPRRLLDWWQKQLAAPPTADWALALPLPGTNAVRLMTIHKAKGLQAPVVILASMGSGNHTNPVHAYHDNGQLYLSASTADDTTRERIAQETDAENRRLLYVALTRAEDLLYIVQHPRPSAPLKQGQQHASHLQPLAPDTLPDTTHQTSPSSLEDTHEQNPSPYGTRRAAEQRGEGERGHNTPHSDNNSETILHLPPLPAQRPRGWRKTSFTALARHLPAALADTAIHTPLDLELLEEERRASTDTAPENRPIPYAFPRGPKAGSYLHETLEKIRPERRAHWPHLLDKLLDKHHLQDQRPRLPELTAWITHILDTPLASGIPLARITNAQRELGFSLALDPRAPLPHHHLRQHFAAWGKTLPFTRDPGLYRYLRGEIDLLYPHNGRYHIVDYKSNHLGNHPDDYSQNAMLATMDHHHYWLQAALYQLALHRLLQKRLPGYQPQQHLGHVEYYFIRSPDNGHLAIDIPADWLLQLDDILTKNPKK
ncbi:MAG: UvrD-helicase domain-containing protein [Cardiobacteriaceae bacterium]|nr:UvrD-helicase domain-containing protein [Cardiobacteriaceae bacterium]